MSATLTIRDSITRTGCTTINGERAMLYNCNIDSEDPTKMTLANTILDHELYKKNIDVCRADRAEFEDAAYALQKQYIDQKAQEVTE